jgi:hypothetical protein
MKKNTRSNFILTFAISVTAIALMCSASEAYRSRSTDLNSELKITLSTDKPVYKPNTEVFFTETFQNDSSRIIQIIDDKCGYGADITIERMSDRHVCAPVEGGATHTLKPGLRPGTRQYLKPGESFKRKFSAFITKDFLLAFQNHGSAGFTGFSGEATNVKNLPPKFFGCGAIYGLEKPGKYRLSTAYLNNGEWSTGEIKPSMPLWQGRVQSRPIMIEIQD